MASVRKVSAMRCPKIATVECHFPLIPSALTGLILDGCVGLADLPEGLATKFTNLAELGLANCSALDRLPTWVNEIERKGAGVIRPSHLA
jgi:hypothetical protein